MPCKVRMLPGTTMVLASSIKWAMRMRCACNHGSYPCVFACSGQTYGSFRCWKQVHQWGPPSRRPLCDSPLEDPARRRTATLLWCVPCADTRAAGRIWRTSVQHRSTSPQIGPLLVAFGELWAHCRSRPPLGRLRGDSGRANSLGQRWAQRLAFLGPSLALLEPQPV